MSIQITAKRVSAGLLALAAGAAMALTGPPASATGPGTARHVRPAATHRYPTKVTGLRVRTLPSTDAKTVKVLGAAGTRVYVDCYSRGQSIHGDAVWYHVVSPAKGFVSAYYVRSGHDPAPGVPSCAKYYRAR